MTSDPADLSNLHDIVVPPPVSWWPPAPGWWIVGAALLAGLALLVAKLVLHYRRNAYRRAALAELDALGAVVDAAGAERLSAVLKRAALVAFPRTEVASLTGTAWLAFLDRTAGMDDFTKGTAMTRIAYGGMSGTEDTTLIKAARRWVKRHRASHGAGG